LATIISPFSVPVPLEYATSAHAQKAYVLTRTSQIALQVVRTSFGVHLREYMGSSFPPPPPPEINLLNGQGTAFTLLLSGVTLNRFPKI